jgi:serine/threonine protein kinase
MGTVFLARDVTLDRRVAIKIIRPELATARACGRFLREARILANLKHPNVMPIHGAGEADSLFYYVMDYVEGRTLADRLECGRLSPTEARKLGRDLLDALEAVHQLGVVHRDIKPSNVFLMGDRAMLGDFGIAKPSDGQSSTATGARVGTPRYMPPEQAFGAKVTHKTDLYAVGIVLYEAFSGREWTGLRPDHQPDWSGVPRSIVPILRRALAWDPSDRWSDAAAFRHKLWRTRTRRYRRRTLLLTLGGVVVGATAYVLYDRLTSRPDYIFEVAVAPFHNGNGIDPDLANELTYLAWYNIETFVTTAPRSLVRDWWNTTGRSLDSIGRAPEGSFAARYIAHASISSSGVDTTVTIQVLDERGNRLSAGTVHMKGNRGLAETGHRVGYQIARIVSPNRESEYKGAFRGKTDAALNAFLEGLRRFERNAFLSATDRFAEAVRLDAEFGLAAWWLSNAWRWGTTGEPHRDVELSELLSAQASDLPQLDSMLIEAQLAHSAAERFALYRDAIERHPRYGYPAFLYAEELQTRGAFDGIPMDSSVVELRIAAEKDTTFGPALLHLLFSYVRLGVRDSAISLLQRFKRISVPEETFVDQPLLMEIVVAERFLPDQVDRMRGAILEQPDLAEDVIATFRLAAMYDLAPMQVDLGELLLITLPNADAPTRGHFHEARGLGLIAMGRIREALSHLDSAAALLGTPEARAEAAEWRLVAPAPGVGGVPDREVETGRVTLRQMVDDSVLVARSRWALGLDAVAHGDLPSASDQLAALRNAAADTTAERLAVLLYAATRAAAGRYRPALHISEVLLAYDSAGRGGDPFARAALHLKRSEWYDSIGDYDAADAAGLWYEHFEWREGFPSGVAQAAEIDWALATYARWLRGERAIARRDRHAACRHLERVTELWVDADSAYIPLRDRAEQYVRESCRR